MKQNILWDLDGTLTNPRLGIIKCFQYALKESGHLVPDDNDLLWVIGPPIQHSFSILAPKLLEADIWKLVTKYRERFAVVGLFENEVYDGISEILSSLNGKNNYIATSKPRVFADKILNHFNHSRFFNEVYGSELDGTRSDKGELIELILKTENISAKDAVIIGDRKYDIIGAKKTGISSIGITWGYGSIEELKEAGADMIFDSPDALKQLLLQ